MRNGLLQYPSVSSSDSTDDGLYDNFLSSSGTAPSVVLNPSPLPPVVLSEEAIQSEAAQTGPFTEVTVGSGGITFDLLFDAAASSAAAASFRAGIEQAASMLAATITDKITINLEVDWSGTGGGASSGPTDGTFEPYSTVYSDLVNNAPAGSTLFNALPNSSSVQGQSEVAVWNAQLKLWGLPVQSGSPTVVVNGVTYTVDGSSTFATDINSSELVGVALHEITHAMGRVPYGSQPDVFDLFRFTSAGTMLFSSAIPTSAAYFSVDGGKTVLANYGLYSDPSDFLNAGPDQLGTPYSNLTPNDPFDELYGSNTTQKLTALDIEQLNVLGFHTTTGTTTGSPSASTSSIISSQSTVAADGHSTTTLTVTVEDANHDLLSGVAVTLSGSGSGNIFGSISGTTNANGVFTTTLASTLAQSEIITASEGAVQEQVTVNFSTVVQTDTNSFGTAELVQVGNDYYVENTVTGATAELKYGGAPITVGEWGGWVPIGAAQTSTGYEVAWDLPGANQYTVWNIDTNGNDTTTAVASVPGTSTALETLELSFNQDLNSDGTIGIPPPSASTSSIISSQSTVTADGHSTTTLTVTVEDANHDLLSGVAVTLSASGSNNTFGAISGTTNASGVFTTTLASTLAQSEIITASEGGVQEQVTVNFSKVIQTDINSLGTTELIQIGNDYYVENTGTGLSAELKYGGAPITVGEWGGWVPIGAALTSTGYEVAWDLPGANQYTVWNIDTNGNDTTTAVASVPGTSTALETLELSFNQDLNSDGTIGIPTSGSASASTSSIISSQSTVTADGHSTTTLTVTVEDANHDLLSGVPVTLSASGSDNIFGTISGTTNANGVFTTTLASTLAQIETITASEGAVQEQVTVIFGTAIQTDANSIGTTELVQVGNDYYVENTVTGATAELKYGGAPITVGEWGGWVPIGAAQTATGYEVAWELPGTNQYTVWNIDTNGNDTTTAVASVPGTSTALETLELSFNQDLNGDDVIGIPSGVHSITSSTISQSSSVAVADNDNFKFDWGNAPGAGAQTASPHTVGPGASSWFNGNYSAPLFGDANTAPSQTLFQPAHDGHDTITNPDGAAAMNFHFTDPHAGHFIIS